MEVKSLHIVNKEMDVVVMGGSRDRRRVQEQGLDVHLLNGRSAFEGPNGLILLLC